MKKEQKKIILDEISTRFIPFYDNLGFEFDRKLLKFRKDEQIVMLEPEAEYEARIIFAISLSTQNDKIKLIKDKIFPEIPTSLTTYKLQENTLDITQFGYQQYYKGWSISNSNDIIAMLEDHKLFMANCGFQFLTSFSKLDGIHENLNLRILNEHEELKNTMDSKLRSYIGDREILSGLITAFLINFDRIEKLVGCYKKLYQSENIDLLIDRVVNYFKNQPT